MDVFLSSGMTNLKSLSKFSSRSASVNNLQAKVDALEKSNTKLTEEVGNIHNLQKLSCKIAELI